MQANQYLSHNRLPQDQNSSRFKKEVIENNPGIHLKALYAVANSCKDPDEFLQQNREALLEAGSDQKALQKIINPNHKPKKPLIDGVAKSKDGKMRAEFSIHKARILISNASEDLWSNFQIWFDSPELWDDFRSWSNGKEVETQVDEWMNTGSDDDVYEDLEEDDKNIRQDYQVFR